MLNMTCVCPGQISQTVLRHHWQKTVEDVIHFAFADGQTDISDGNDFINHLQETVVSFFSKA